MTAVEAPAKINLALVVGPVSSGGKHEVVTVLQRVDLADRIAVVAGDGLSVTGFAGDTIVTQALEALATAAGVEPCFSVEITKVIPVAAGLGGGSSDAAAALTIANRLLPVPLRPDRLESVAGTIGADVPFFLRPGPQLGRGDGTILTPLELPQTFHVLLLLPDDEIKASTREVYAAFDERGGEAGFERRRAALEAELVAMRDAMDLAALPPNDLASSVLAGTLRGLGAFRADVSGAGPCVYGLFGSRGAAESAAEAVRALGRTWVVTPRST